MYSLYTVYIMYVFYKKLSLVHSAYYEGFQAYVLLFTYLYVLRKVLNYSDKTSKINVFTDISDSYPS